MESSVATLSRRRAASAQHQSQLGQLCGSRLLFRDRYRVIQPLGRGGFGVTYLARDATLPSAPTCVIKQLCPKVNNPVILQKARERFEREAKTLSQLGSHAQVPQLLDYFEMGEEFFLVQEYVKGANLAKEVKTKGVLSEVSVKRFLREILPVLDYIHQNQVIHRDIKPPNIIRCEDDGRLVLIDFGAVKEQIAQVSEVSQKVPTTQFVGTVGFAPPEQLALRPVYASDIYAIGVTCLYLMTGRSPMEFDTDSITGEILWENQVSITPHFGKILSKMIKVSVRERYQSVEQVQRALDLEPYADNLAECMNTRRSQDVVEADDRYLPPIARTARDIRNWRTRLKAKEVRRDWKSGGIVVSNSFY